MGQAGRVLDEPAGQVLVTAVLLPARETAALLREISDPTVTLESSDQRCKIESGMREIASLVDGRTWAVGDSFTALLAAIPLLLLKLAIGGVFLAGIETVNAKLRIFRAPEFLGTAFMLAVLGLLVRLLLEVKV